MTSRNNLIIPQKEVILLPELTTLDTCDTVDSLFTLRSPSISGVCQQAQNASRKRRMNKIPSTSMCVNINYILLLEKASYLGVDVERGAVCLRKY